MRDPGYEREWCLQAGREAGQWGHIVERFTDEVFRRLMHGAREYGEDSFMDKPVSELIAEKAEEGADAAAWGVLISQRLRSEELADDDVGAEIQLLLVSAAGDALNLWRKMERAGYLYRTEAHSVDHRRAVQAQNSVT